LFWIVIICAALTLASRSGIIVAAAG